jgi:hypothetical protein
LAACAAAALLAVGLGAGLTLSRATTNPQPGPASGSRTPEGNGPERERGSPSGSGRSRHGHAGLELHVPHATAPIPIDAEIEGKKVWEPEAGSTLNLKEDGGSGMVPYTEAKLRWGDGRLYLLLYAGDLDLEGVVKQADGRLADDDAFHLELGPAPEKPDGVRVVEVSVLGTVADARCGLPMDVGAPIDIEGPGCDRSWESHAVVAVDKDGTVNRAGDNDEEWVVEMALPLDALGLADARPGARLAFAVQRCEVGGAGRAACGSWGLGRSRGEIILDP